MFTLPIANLLTMGPNPICKVPAKINVMLLSEHSDWLKKISSQSEHSNQRSIKLRSKLSLWNRSMSVLLCLDILSGFFP